ncbi:hypothetical protein XH93_08830 [Bradyrhizobium sp. CCBAU 51753]|nr:hypothetical protein XH93_08830 [Bradyrhizobium sp. CCBAU 51753]
MLERSGVRPSKDHPTKVFTRLGVTHTAGRREEGFIRLTPSLDPTLWPKSWLKIDLRILGKIRLPVSDHGPRLGRAMSLAPID